MVAPRPRCGYGHASSDVESRESRWYMLAVPPADDEQQRGAVRYAYDGQGSGGGPHGVSHDGRQPARPTRKGISDACLRTRQRTNQHE